jgi:NADH dehydrogenase FAD-containing subunit
MDKAESAFQNALAAALENANISQDKVQINLNVNVTAPEEQRSSKLGLLASKFGRKKRAASSERKKVVVLGAGYAGQHVATSLDKYSNDFDVVMIDARDHHVHKVSGLRAATLGGDWAQATCISREKMLKNGRFVKAKVALCGENQVYTSDGQQFSYDYLVCATGARSFSVGEPPLSCDTKEKAVEYFQRAAGAIKQAQRIVIVGGGAVGVELAGEIASQYTYKKTSVSKSITIVHAGEQVLSNQPIHMKAKYYRKLDEQFDKLNIQRKFNVKVVGANPEPAEGLTELTVGHRTLLLSNGEELQADLVLWCVGFNNSTSFYPQEWMNASGQVEVDETLAVKAALGGNVFAPGDLNDVHENKMKYTATAQADVVVKNLKKLAAGDSAKYKYKPSGVGVVLTNLGPNLGVSDFFGKGVVGSTITSTLKGKTLNVPEAYKLAKQPTPVLYNGKVGKYIVPLGQQKSSALQFAASIKQEEQEEPQLEIAAAAGESDFTSALATETATVTQEERKDSDEDDELLVKKDLAETRIIGSFPIGDVNDQWAAYLDRKTGEEWFLNKSTYETTEQRPTPSY